MGKSLHLMLSFYKPIVWPPLEYSEQFWPQQMKRDVVKLGEAAGKSKEHDQSQATPLRRKDAMLGAVYLGKRRKESGSL